MNPPEAVCAWTADVLTMSVPLLGVYPSKNRLQVGPHVGAAKPPGYKALFAAIEAAGGAAVAAGWQTIARPCCVTLTRLCPDNHRFDAANLGSAECDALTAGGVWTDDRLAQDVLKRYRPGSGGFDRIVIIVERLSALGALPPRKPAPAVRAPTGPQALLNGKPISLAQARRLAGLA